MEIIKEPMRYLIADNSCGNHARGTHCRLIEKYDKTPTISTNCHTTEFTPFKGNTPLRLEIILQVMMQ